MSSLRTRSMTRTLADTVADRVSAARMSFPRLERPPRSCSRTWWCWASSPASPLLFRFAARAVHPVRRHLAGDGGQARRRMAAPPRHPALGRRAGDLRRARLPVRRRADAGGAGDRRTGGDAGRARAPPVRTPAHRAAGVGEQHPAPHRLVPARRRRAQRRRPRSTSRRVLDTGGAVGRNLFTIAAVLLLGFYWTLEGERRMRALALFAPFDRRRVDPRLPHRGRAHGRRLPARPVAGLPGHRRARVRHLPRCSACPTPASSASSTRSARRSRSSVRSSARSSRRWSRPRSGPSLVLGVIVAAVFLQLFENYVLIPRVMVRTVGISPLVTLLAITAFASVLGIAGAILAIPLAAIVQLLLSRFLLGADAQHGEPPVGRDHLSAVRYEVRELIVDLRKLAPRAPRRSRIRRAGRGRHRRDRARPGSAAGRTRRSGRREADRAGRGHLARDAHGRGAAVAIPRRGVAVRAVGRAGRRRPTRDRRARAPRRPLARRSRSATCSGSDPVRASSSTWCRAASCTSSTRPPSS